jgi:glutaredoxin 3
MVKEFLSQRGIGFEEIDVARDRTAAQELVHKTGQMGVPVIVIDGQTIVGFDRVKLDQIISQRQKPVFGASVADASKIAGRQETGLTAGAYIGKVRPGSLAERLGLRPEDTIVEINMQTIANAIDLEKAIVRLSKGNRISVLFIRDSEQLSAEGIV